MNGDLLQTKLIIPLLRPNLVPRSHLVERLDAGRDVGGKLSLICAPAGFGKTTLTADWVHSREQAVAWLSLDEDDNDPVRFFTYVIAALRKIATARDQDGWSEFGSESLQVLQSAQKPPLNVVLTGLINQIAATSEPIMLVLDDYHLIQTRAIHQAVAFLLDNQPPNFHLAMTTREDPPIPLSRMRARQELTEIRLADLRFSGEETAVLLNQVMGLDLSAAQIETLENRTEGWISGLQLAALSMRGSEDIDLFVRSFAGSNRYILDYLMEQVFEQQPPEIQTFLLHTSVLDQLCAPLCDAVLDDAAAQAGISSLRLTATIPASQLVLEQLEDANLFIIPLDEKRAWFRYHHLFAGLLRHRLSLSPLDAGILHSRAGAWYAERGLADKAIQHYLAADAWDEAAQLMENRSDILLKRGEGETLIRWARALPDEVMHQHPRSLHELHLGFGAHWPPGGSRGLSANRRSRAGTSSATWSRSLDSANPHRQGAPRLGAHHRTLAAGIGQHPTRSARSAGRAQSQSGPGPVAGQPDDCS